MFGRKQLVIFIIVVASISPFVFFSSSMQPWQDKGRGVTILQEFIYPFQYVWHLGATNIKKNWQRYFNFVDSTKNVQALKIEVDQLKSKIIDYDHQVQEIARLRELLQFKKSNVQNLVPAEIISIGNNTPFRSLRIDKGRLDNIDVGMPVIAPQGVVGRVIRTGLRFSDVLLIDDNNFHLDAIIERTRHRGVVQGVLNNLCQLKFHKRANIKIGDTLITSGALGGFPKGIPIGKVSKIIFKSDNVTQSITVEPWVELNTLEEVMVIKGIDPEVQEIKNTAGEVWLDKATEKIGE